MCGESVDEDEIVEEYDYNDDVTIRQMPWMVSLGQFVSSTKWVHDCGGSVITKRYMNRIYITLLIDSYLL